MLHVDKNNFASISSEENRRQISQRLWHFRLGYLNAHDMKKLVDRQMANGLSKGITDVESDFCESCVYGRKTRGSFPPNKNARSHRILELIHTDVCGPMPTSAYDGSRYFVTFTDNFSRASMVYCIQRKSETLDKFKEFVAMVETLHGCKIAKLKADNGGEYTVAPAGTLLKALAHDFLSRVTEQMIKTLFKGRPQNFNSNTIKQQQEEQ